MKNSKNFINKYKFNICLLLTLALVPALMYAKYYFNDVYIFNADGVVEVSILAFIKDSIISGEWPLWNKYLSVGMPTAGNISMHSFYLPAIILSFLPLKLYIYSFYILHITVGAFFFFLLLKQIGCRKEIAAVMAFVYVFSINLGGLRKSHLAIIITAIYLPVIIYFIERYLETERFRWLSYATIAMAFQFCGGFAQCILYSDVFVGVYLVIGLLKRKNWKKGIAHFSMWLSSYFGLIAVQLLPFIELLRENSKMDNQTANVYEYFIVYSLHPIKLLQMVFPKIFGNEYMAFGEYLSSGFDIELYMGPAIILLLIGGILIYRKEFRIKAYGIAAVLIFCWGSIACFPMVAKVASRLPFIGSTRAQSRIIFIFCFLILLMVGYISELIVSRSDYQSFFKVAKFMVEAIVFAVVIGFVGAFIYAGAQGFEGDICNSLIVYFKTAFYKDIILFGLCLLTLFCLCLNEERRGGKNRYIFLWILLAINMCGTLPYSLRTDETSVADTLGENNDADEFLMENIGYYKAWDDFTGIDGGHQSNISQNKGVVKKIASINSYTNLTNPRLYMIMSESNNAPLNYSGLLTGNLLANVNIKTRNDILSMLGIKFIIDTEGYLENNQNSYVCSGEGQEIMHIEKVEGEVTTDRVYVSGYTIQLKPHTIYRISFNGSAMVDENIYCDFYGEQYDSNDQQSEFTLTNEKSEYEFYMFSGENVPEQAVIRFVCSNLKSEVIIENVHISEMETYAVPCYQLANSEGNYNIYENINANDILYFSNVHSLEESNSIYQAVGLNLDKNSYIEDGVELSNTSSNKEITDVDFGINSIKANVYTDEDSFLNFSQTYYSGWKVYVDGKEQKKHLVNGVIMGVYVPSGNHTVEFCYKPTSVAIGAFISLFTIGVLVLLGILNTKCRIKKEVISTS